jgi:hypothetical protein
MKINSNFRDFYDFAVCPCNNDEIIWNRYENLAQKEIGQKVSESFKEFKVTYSTSTQYYVTDEILDKINIVRNNLQDLVYDIEEILIVGEIVYSTIKLEFDEDFMILYDTNENKFRIYKNNELLSIVEKFENKKQIIKWFKLEGVKNPSFDKVTIKYLTDKMIDERLNRIKNIVRYHFLDVPLIRIYRELGQTYLTLNPKLSETIWKMLLNPIDIYQEIELFLFDDNKIIEISNEDKIKAKGFDIKKSFRK